MIQPFQKTSKKKNKHQKTPSTKIAPLDSGGFLKGWPKFLAFSLHGSAPVKPKQIWRFNQLQNTTPKFN